MTPQDDIFSAVADYTYDWETWFLPNGQVRWINRAVERITGYGVEECLDLPDYPLPLVHEEDRARLSRLLGQAMGGSSGNDVEFRVLRKDGSTGWAAVSWQPMTRDGVVIGVRTSMRDISQRKRAEDALRAAKAEAERANLAKSRVLAAVSHDLRQPLQAISMNVAALRHHLPDERASGILEDIRLCIAAGNELLEDLLDVTRLDAGAVVPHPANIALADIFERVETSFAAEAEERRIELRIMSSSQFVHCDPGMLTRILQNLVANALRYTPAGRVLVGCRRRGNTIRVEVWDTGIGLAPEQFEHIFEEFYQVGNEQRDRRRGAGLGLAIVRRTAALMGASVSVRSREGKGSVFSVTLPLAGKPDRQAPKTSENAPPQNIAGLAIAVIDDEVLQLDALNRLLTSRGATVLTAHSAGEVLNRMGDKEGFLPQVVVADYRLENGATGLEAIVAIRDAAGRRIPALLLTGEMDAPRAGDGESQADRLLRKPVEADVLCETLAGLSSASSRAP